MEILEEMTLEGKWFYNFTLFKNDYENNLNLQYQLVWK